MKVQLIFRGAWLAWNLVWWLDPTDADLSPFILQQIYVATCLEASYIICTKFGKSYLQPFYSVDWLVFNGATYAQEINHVTNLL